MCGCCCCRCWHGPDPIHRLVKIPLGRVDGWPRWVKIILPFVATAVLWWLASWLLGRLQITAAGFAGASVSSNRWSSGLDSYLAVEISAGAPSCCCIC